MDINARTLSKFDAAKKSGRMVILYHMNGCPHCIMMRPAWDSVKRDLSGRCNMAEVEYGNLSLLPQEMQMIRGFPTLMAYRNGVPVAEYNGDRSPESLRAFAMTYAAAPTPAPAAATPVAPKKTPKTPKKSASAPKKTAATKKA